jgi:hypothetical protein
MKATAANLPSPLYGKPAAILAAIAEAKATATSK